MAELPFGVGVRGYRVLDGLRFSCEILRVTEEPLTISVYYLDDGTIEHDVEPDEFEQEDTPTASPIAMTHDRFLYPLPSHGSASDCILIHVVQFFEPFVWLGRLIRVSRGWQNVVKNPSLWQTLRIRSRLPLLPRLFDVQLHNDIVVREVLENVALDDSDVADDQVVALGLACVQLTTLSLQRCHRLSFMIVYELLRLSRERHGNGEPSLQSLDLWLCRGISPAFVTQLMTPRHEGHRHTLAIRGPGFFFLEVAQSVAATLDSHATRLPHWPSDSTLSILWVQTSVLLELIHQVAHNPQWQSLQRHVPLLKAASVAEIVPLARFESFQDHHVCLGIPACTVSDLTRLIQDSEPCHAIRTQLLHSINVLAVTEPSHPPFVENLVENDPLTAQATKVFAMLRETTEQLQSQVDRLEHQVATMAQAKAVAEREYKDAQKKLQRVAQEADRALLTLATSCDPTNEPEKPPENGLIRDLPEDVFLPPLPSSETIATLAQSLEDEWFAVLDGFVGVKLCTKVRDDAEQMYINSRAAEIEVPENVSPSPPPAPGRFTLGELAGGHTGRNLRYQMAHVRGDYMFWLDEHDAVCPQSIRLVLRQLDRLILERLSVVNHELSMSALLRNKAMLTCYPGQDKARYTRHCDNPNRNGRRLTAILYLNPNWDSVCHGGELLLHRDKPRSSTDDVRVAPQLDRLLLFFSDTRVPHEVLPCTDATRDRFALTVWYLDYDEFMHAQVFGTSNQDDEARERQRIRHEIERMRTTH